MASTASKMVMNILGNGIKIKRKVMEYIILKKIMKIL
jgi:hypothetical protein